MLNVKTIYAVDPVSTKAMDTQELRDAFHLADMFCDGQINLTYTHYDRMIVGAAVPNGGVLKLDHIADAGTPSILDRREIGILNIGEKANVTCGDDTYEVGEGDILYLGMGAGAITFSGQGRFYMVSSPAHRSMPNKLIKLEDAASLYLGSRETANERTIYMFVHPEVMESCQLVMGYTKFHGGSVWNTMPAHVHDRRMEAYLYFDVAKDNRVFHFMGEPHETRHIVMKNEEVVVSPPWSIHCGAGTGSYTFCWAMAGDNVDYKDVDMVAMEDLR
jgi:4-deoxy-L-threo-5-hexosulose-uronate ketol-isomerase